MQNETPNLTNFTFPMLNNTEMQQLTSLYQYCSTIPKPNYSDSISGAEALIPITTQTESFNVGIVFLSNMVPNTAQQLQNLLGVYSAVCEASIKTVQEAYQFLVFKTLLEENGEHVPPQPVVTTKPSNHDKKRGRPVGTDKEKAAEKAKRSEAYQIKLENYQRRRQTLEMCEQEYKVLKQQQDEIISAMEEEINKLKEQHNNDLKHKREHLTKLKSVHADNWTEDMYRV